MTHDGRCSLQRRSTLLLAWAVGLGCLAGQAVFPQNAGRKLLLSEAGKAFFPLPSTALAYDDAPLCMARQPGGREDRDELLMSRDVDMSCRPDEFIETTGPFWTAPITSAEARQALSDADTLAQRGQLMDALLKLRVVEHAMPRIADRIALRRAQLLLRMDRPDEAYRAYQMAADSPERNIAAQARLGIVRGLLESGKREGEAELDKACKRYPNLGERGSLRLALAKAKETWGNKAGAAAIYRTIDLNDPESEAAEGARAALARLRAEGVPVKPLSPAEIIERAERIVKTGTLEDARAAVAEICSNTSLPAAIRGKGHALAARIARNEGDWDKAREEVQTALSLGAAPGECLRYLPRGLPPAKDADERAAMIRDGEAKIRKLVGPLPTKRGRAQTLKQALDIAVQYQLAEPATALLDALRQNKQAQGPMLFSAAILASGLASDESVANALEKTTSVYGIKVASLYHHARALERLGRYTEAAAEYREVIAEDDSSTRYYAMWAGVQLAQIPQTRGNCATEGDGDGPTYGLPSCANAPQPTQAPAEGLMTPSTEAAARIEEGDTTGSIPGVLVEDGEGTRGIAGPSLEEPDAVTLDARRQAVTRRLAPLIADHGAAFPWLARAADLIQLDLYEDAADEIGEAYLAYRDARGDWRLRAGVDAVLTGSAPARHAALGPVRRDRLALGPIAREELASIAEMLGDPGIALRMRDERRELRPRAYESDVEAAAIKYGLDPNLLFAVMRVESIYHRQIVSHAGAIGLMQIMPRTGRLISRELGVEDFDTIDLLNPRTNLEFAAWYLSSLIKRFDGRLPLAIASYNGGPHNVRLWMSAYPPSMPLDAFLERIPFEETHRYVRRVLTHYAAYRAQQNLPMTKLSVELPKIERDEVAF
jgi:soluble lytic murein transglycosylase-like protein